MVLGVAAAFSAVAAEGVAEPASPAVSEASAVSPSNVRLLAFNRVLATFEGIEHKPCMFLTALCPDKCQHARDVAKFKVVRYLDYGSFGQYGDAPQDIFYVSMKEDDREDPQAPAVLAAIRGLKQGDGVELSWAHLYVTHEGLSSPQRRVLGVAPAKLDGAADS